MGHAEERVGRPQVAGAAYERAAALYPTAQSPLLGLALLARQHGNQAQASAAMRRLWALGDSKNRSDPWPDYYLMQGADAEALIQQLYLDVRDLRTVPPRGDPRP